jgi:hypothetical protein
MLIMISSRKEELRNISNSKKLENNISHNFKTHKKVPQIHILQNCD